MDIANYIGKVLAGVLLYYLLGRLGLSLTLPPGHATVFWPPAGLALAIILFYGNRMWPLVFLGAISTTLSHGPITTDALILACSVATGATLQALAGNYFIRNSLSPPFILEDLREIFLILLLGGIVAGGISATVGSGSLYFAGIITADDIARSWLTWYVGDVIGIFLFCPFILILLSPITEVSIRRKIVVCTSLTVMLGLTGLIFSLVSNWEKAKEKEIFNDRAMEIAKSLKQELSNYPDILKSIEDLFAASDEVTYEEFETFTARFLDRYPNIRALSWNQKVLETEREAYIDYVRSQGFSDFQITRRLAGNRLVKATKSPVHFPVTYTTPYEQNKAAHGFDTYSIDPYNGKQRKETLDKARLMDKALTTGRVSLIQSEMPYSLLIYKPIYIDDSLKAPQKYEMDNLRGYAAAVLQIKAMISDVVEDAAAQGMHLILMDRSAPPKKRLLYDSRTPNNKESIIPIDIHPEALHHQSFLSFAGHGFEINFLQKNEMVGKEFHLILWITLFTGLIFTGLLSVLLLIVSGRTDIFERMVNEKARELQETDNILEQSLNEIYIFDAKTLHFLHANEAARENLQYSMEELKELTPLDLDPNYTNKNFAKMIAPLLEGNERKLVFQKQHTRKDGTKYDVEVYLQRAFYKGEDAFLAVIIDVTEKAKVEKELRLYEHDMKLIFKNVPVRIWYKDNKNNIIRLNQAAAESMGGTVEDFEGKSTYDLFPEMAKKYHDDDLEVINSGSPKLGIIEEYTPVDGEKGWVITDKVPYKDPSSGRSGLLVVAQDITELKQAEENLEEAVEKLTASNEELERFAYIASHDLQEPLRMVRNFTELLETRYGEELDDTAKSYIAIASSSAKHMQALVDDLLDYARVEQEGNKIEIVDPEQTLDYVKTSLHDRITKTAAVISSDPFPTISVNPVSFSCLMQNFIGNALKYTKPGTVPKVHVGIKEGEDEWVFSVNDNGIGMKEEYLEQIFQPFKRLHTREEYTGTGMGLAICRKTVENLGGRIWVESKIDVGSTFYFSIPKQDWEIDEDESGDA